MAIIYEKQEYQCDLNEVLFEFPPFDGDIFLQSFDGEKFIVKIIILDEENIFEYEKLPTDKLLRRRLEKRYLKLSLYKVLSKHFNINLPWGALTGIRPTKFAYQQGENWKDFFKKEMFVSDEKISLIAKILDTQKGIYSIDDSNAGLYVSVPFCPSRCAYCSFISCEIAKEKYVDEYIDALVKEIDSAKKLIKNLRGIYIGGGTPVCLSDYHFTKLLDAVGKNDVEYTIEAGRPDAIDENKLKIMKDYGVTRVCVNPQTFLDRTLKIIGRKHTAEQIIDKYHLVKSYDFDVNMDLIAGLPQESLEDFKFSLDKAVMLRPDNITVHTLCLKKGSILREKMERLPDCEVKNMVEYSHKTLSENGYNPYYLYRQKYMAENLENTGYSLPNKECVYNIDIMEETTNIVACGGNGVSKKVDYLGGKIIRLGEPKDVLAYLKKVNEIIDEKNKLFG